MISSGKVLRSVRAWALGAAAVAALASCGGGTTQSEAFKPERVIAFGDESSVLTSAGLKYSVNGLGTTGAIDCVANPLWIQTVAGTYSYVFAQCNPAASTAVNAFTRAAVGAKVADLKNQLDAQVAGDGIKAKDLVTMLAGANDVFELYAQYPSRSEDELTSELRTRAQALATQVNRVVDLGGRVIVSTLPDLGLTPFALAQKAAFTDTDRAALLTRLTAAFNGRLRTSILNDGRYVGLVLADEMVQVMVRSPAGFGLTDATRAVCSVALPDCTTATVVEGGDAATWLWADSTQMATAGQQRLGLLAQQRATNNPF